MPLRAVVFDYGNVLTIPQDPADNAEFLRLTGLPAGQFARLYWQDRHDYDAGKYTGATFWQKFNRDAGLNLSGATIQDLNRADGRMWADVNPRMVAWQEQLRQRGLKRAVLSNMPGAVRDELMAALPWLSTFDALVWSYELGVIKPDPAIYRAVLGRLALPPEETLFLDDRAENTAAARALGMNAIVFATPEKLRADLIAAGYDAELPLP